MSVKAKEITGVENYKSVMAHIYAIMKKGEANTTESEEKELQKLVFQVQKYEKVIYNIPIS